MNAPAETEVDRRVRLALDHIQTAQGELGRASAALSALVGALPEWNRAGKLYDQVKALWHRVDRERPKYSLDGMRGAP